MASAKHIPQTLNQLLGTLESYQQAQQGLCLSKQGVHVTHHEATLMGGDLEEAPTDGNCLGSTDDSC